DGRAESCPGARLTVAGLWLGVIAFATGVPAFMLFAPFCPALAGAGYGLALHLLMGALYDQPAAPRRSSHRIHVLGGALAGEVAFPAIVAGVALIAFLAQD